MFKATGLAVRGITAAAVLIGASGGVQRVLAATINVTIEAPGVQNSTAAFTAVGVETFDSFGTGTQPHLTSTFGGGIVGLSAAIDGPYIGSANVYAGAGGTGNFAADYSGPITVTLNQNVTYFGLWISAMNDGNVITLYNGATEVTTFDTATMDALVGGNTGYFGNPNSNFLHGDPQEPFAFVNFYDETGSFNKIVLSGIYFETDNYTVGTFASESGTSVVPEPATMTIMGVGVAGLGMIRRRRVMPRTA